MDDRQLENVLAEMQQVNQDAEQLVAGLGEQQLNWTSAPGAWSINQCLEHLTRASDEFLPHLEKAIARAKQRGDSGKAYQPTIMGKWLIGITAQEAGRKFKAPKNFQPPPNPAPGALVRFLAAHQRLASLVERTKGLDLNVTLRSPVTALMRYSLGDAYQVSIAHAKRHLRQARRVRENPDFPRAADQ